MNGTKDDEMNGFDFAVVIGVLVIVGSVMLILALQYGSERLIVEKRYVTTETVLSPGDLAISGTNYVGSVGNMVEFESGDKTLKYTYEEGKKIKLGEDRSVTLKKISGDNLTISERRFVRVNKFNDQVLDGK